MSGELLLIEFHDSHLSQVLVDTLERVRIEFPHFVCYFATDDPAVVEVWMCQAELLIERLESIAIKFPVHESSRVSDCELEPLGEQADRPDVMRLLEGIELAGVKILLEGMAEIVTKGGVYRILLGDRTKYLKSVPRSFVE